VCVRNDHSFQVLDSCEYFQILRIVPFASSDPIILVNVYLPHKGHAAVWLQALDKLQCHPVWSSGGCECSRVVFAGDFNAGPDKVNSMFDLASFKGPAVGVVPNSRVPG